jgi:hypothetical protein
MGMTRKIMSVLTFGLIDDRSDKERTARSARKSAKRAKAQKELMRGRLQQQHTAEVNRVLYRGEQGHRG